MAQSDQRSRRKPKPGYIPTDDPEGLLFRRHSKFDPKGGSVRRPPKDSTDSMFLGLTLASQFHFPLKKWIADILGGDRAKNRQLISSGGSCSFLDTLAG